MFRFREILGKAASSGSEAIGDALSSAEREMAETEKNLTAIAVRMETEILDLSDEALAELEAEYRGHGLTVRRLKAATSLAPRGLSRVQAAAYVGVSATLFDAMVSDGSMPGPKPLLFRSRKT